MRIAIIVGACLVAGSAAAAELPITPGLWKTTANVTNPFGGGVTTNTSEECITETSYDPRKMMEDVKDCEFTRNEVDGDTLNFAMECNMQGSRTVMTGRFVSQGDSGHGEMEMNMNAGGMAMQMKMDWTAERIGDC